MKEPLLAALAGLLMLLPAQMRASCLVHVVGNAPQPLAEPCDRVLLSHENVRINLATFDFAPGLGLFVLPGLMLSIWQNLIAHRIASADFGCAPDTPPPRFLAALLRRFQPVPAARPS